MNQTTLPFDAVLTSTTSAPNWNLNFFIHNYNENWFDFVYIESIHCIFRHICRRIVVVISSLVSIVSQQNDRNTREREKETQKSTEINWIHCDLKSDKSVKCDQNIHQISMMTVRKRCFIDWSRLAMIISIFGIYFEIVRSKFALRSSINMQSHLDDYVDCTKQCANKTTLYDKRRWTGTKSKIMAEWTSLKLPPPPSITSNSGNNSNNNINLLLFSITLEWQSRMKRTRRSKMQSIARKQSFKKIITFMCYAYQR